MFPLSILNCLNRIGLCFFFGFQLNANLFIWKVAELFYFRDSQARKEKTYDFIRRDDDEIGSKRDMVTLISSLRGQLKKFCCVTSC